MSGGGTREYDSHFTERKLISTLCRVCPQEGPVVASFISEQERVCRVVDVLCVLYHLQDREIHAWARRQDPSLSMSVGDREWYWVTNGGPEQFFARVGPKLRERYPDVYDSDVLHIAWEYFQILVTGVHIAYMAGVIGYIPSHGEYFTQGLEDWYHRLAWRFGPIRPMPTLQ